MSAYGHQMEREFSAHSLPSRGGSEMGSRYMVESGFYMTSFAAAIFIGALVTVGVLFVTLMIALTVMLQSCESRSKGVIEMQTANDDYNYCKIFTFHAELNNLGPNEFASMCRNLAVRAIKDDYERDLNSSIWLVEKYFDSVAPLNDGLDVVLMDIDDILPSNPDSAHPLNHQLNQDASTDFLEESKHLKQMLLLRLYMVLQFRGWSMFLISRKPERLRNATTEHLTFAGYRGWSSVIMRLDDETEMDSDEYFSKRRKVIQREGFRIAGAISSELDALVGPFSGQKVFKLPNPIYYYYYYYYSGAPKKNMYKSK